MCSRCLRLVALAGALLALNACEREQRRFSEPASLSSAGDTVTMSALQPGTPTPPMARSNPYEGNAFAVSEGKRLYEWFNCNGCHANGGGAIGPPLMDAKWIYGAEPANVFATIVEGRPNGMPSFRGRITDQQVWQLVAYVRSMSGQLRKDVSPGRSDDMSVGPSEQRTRRQHPTTSFVPRSAQQ